MIQITDKSKCCGCTACEAVCGVKAISMKPDAQGFLYPVVDMDRCVDCGLCEKVCPFHPYEVQTDFLQKIYGARLKDSGNLRKSQSGGAFQALAFEMLSRGGVVYGVAFDEELNVRHTRVESAEALPALFRSKYVQSDIRGIYASVIKDLKDGRHVLFSGVGCQVAGLVSLCDKKRINRDCLLTVDVICYGVPSPRYWQDYREFIQNRYGSPMVRYRFRDKEHGGWAGGVSYITLEDSRSFHPGHNFYNPLMFRRSCNECPFTRYERLSDITIGDFWSISKVKPEWQSDNRGASLILIHTPKGADTLEKISGQLEYFESDKEQSRQQQLTHPNPIHPLKDRWERKYESKGFRKAMRSCGIIDPNPLRVKLGAIKSKIFKNLGK